MTSEYIPQTEVAKMVRKVLKANFPATKFSVRTDSYSGGSSIDVRWVNGPTVESVKAVAGHFHGATFDGMIDLKEYHESTLDGKEVHFANDFIFFERDYSDAAMQAAIDHYKGYWADADQTVTLQPSGEFRGADCITRDYEAQRRIMAHLSETVL